MHDYEWAKAELDKAKGDKKGKYRKIAHNTALQIGSESWIALIYHQTAVVTYRPDGTFVLRSNGWQTVTTQGRINNYSPARVYSHKGQWAVYHADDPKTPVKIQKCRRCKGTGEMDGYCSGRIWPYDKSTPCFHGKTEAHEAKHTCWGCNGEGKKDYGSKPIPTPFYEGITVDSTGKVISGPYVAPYAAAQKLTAWDDVPSYPTPIAYNTGEIVQRSLKTLVPGIQERTECPACDISRCPIIDLVPHVNDFHKWTREQIADWLEALDADLSFQPA